MNFKHNMAIDILSIQVNNTPDDLNDVFLRDEFQQRVMFKLKGQGMIWSVKSIYMFSQKKLALQGQIIIYELISMGSRKCYIYLSVQQLIQLIMTLTRASSEEATYARGLVLLK